MTKMHTIEVQPLTAAIKTLVRGFGSDEREVDLVTQNLIEANLTGHDSHGIGMLLRYAEAFSDGGLKANAHIRIVLDGGSLLRLDGQAGFGQVIGHESMELGIARARQSGSCIVALGNSHHLCRIGSWAEMAVAAGLVSVHFVNVISRPIVAPFGGGDARFGTNPFTVGIPVPGGEPIVLDFATSIIAQGKARVAHNKGEAMPPGYLIDNNGMPTTDPKFAVVEPYGALETFGGYKGYGLAVVCELLGGALAAGMACHEPATGKKRVLNGMLTLLFDPAQLSEGASFGNEMQAFIEWVKASPPQPGSDRIRLPGDPEKETRAKRLACGIPIDETSWGEILRAAAILKVNPAEINRLAGIT